jgi:membrane AbrB-like protein
MKAARESWINPALALLLCGATGALCAWLRLPLPWMIGPLAAMAMCNFAGIGLRAPLGSRQLGQIVVGTALGLYFTPLVAREVISFWPLLLLGGVLAIFLGVLGGWVLGRLTGTDATTAFFASVPGGATEMTILGERFGARADRVALAQSLRILAVVIVVPFALTYSGAHGTDLYQPAAVPLDWGRLAALLGGAAAVGGLVARFGMPNAFMFGPLAVATALTVSEIQLSSLPTSLSSAAQVLLGCALGARFERRSLQSAQRYVWGVLASVATTIAAAAGAAWAIAAAWGLPTPTLVLAMAPGGIAEMCITAKVLQLGVPLVTAAQVARVLVLLSTTGPGFRMLRSFRTRS